MDPASRWRTGFCKHLGDIKIKGGKKVVSHPEREGC